MSRTIALISAATFVGFVVPADLVHTAVRAGTGIVLMGLAAVSYARDQKRLSTERAGHKRSEQRNDALWNRLPIGLALCRMSGELIEVNHAYSEMLGRTKEDTLAQTFWGITPKDYAEDEAKQLERLSETGRYGPYEKEVLHKEGHRIPVRSNGMILQLEGMEPVILSAVVDTTETKAAEEESRQINRDLELIVRQRTTEVQAAHEQLQIEFDEREQLNRSLVEASRHAGMADVATGVLHNVGNVLNSVNVSASVMGESLAKSYIENLERVVAFLPPDIDEFKEFVASDERALHLVQFLGEAVTRIRHEQDQMNRELGDLKSNVDHIKEIVSRQQSFARTVGAAEMVDPVELFEDSLGIASEDSGVQVIEIVRDYDEVSSIRIDKHKVVQILVNLIGNARQALMDSPIDKPRLEVRLIKSGESVLKFVVSDNGIGIPHGNLTHIFAHGFTTKPTGHGFGLHSSACAAKELGGSLTAASEGPGLGATFTLELPNAHADVKPELAATC